MRKVAAGTSISVSGCVPPPAGTASSARPRSNACRSAVPFVTRSSSTHRSCAERTRGVRMISGPCPNTSTSTSRTSSNRSIRRRARASAGSRSRPRSCCRWRRSGSPGAGTRPRSGAGSRPGGTRRRAPRAASPTTRPPSAAQDRTQDLLNFNRWLEVSTDGNTQLASLYERRFRNEFRPAFEKWLTEDPLHNVRRDSEPAARTELQARQRGEGRQAEQAGRRAVRTGQGGDRDTPTTTCSSPCSSPSCCSSPASRCGSRGCRCGLLIMGLGTVILVYGGIPAAQPADALITCASLVATNAHDTSPNRASTTTSTPRIVSG